jgi:hypothetical protein
MKYSFKTASKRATRSRSTTARPEDYNPNDAREVSKILTSARKDGQILDDRRKEADENGRVVMLDLSTWKYFLQRLPREIGTLSELRELNLCECFELAAIPPEIGRLSHLRALNESSKLLNVEHSTRTWRLERAPRPRYFK